MISLIRYYLIFSQYRFDTDIQMMTYLWDATLPWKCYELSIFTWLKHCHTADINNSLLSKCLTLLQVDDPDCAGIHDEDPSILCYTKYVLWNTGVIKVEVEAIRGQTLGGVENLVGSIRPVCQWWLVQAPQGSAACPHHQPATRTVIAREGPALSAWKHLEQHNRDGEEESLLKNWLTL